MDRQCRGFLTDILIISMDLCTWTSLGKQRIAILTISAYEMDSLIGINLDPCTNACATQEDRSFDRQETLNGYLYDGQLYQDPHTQEKGNTQ